MLVEMEGFTLNKPVWTQPGWIVGVLAFGVIFGISAWLKAGGTFI